MLTRDDLQNIGTLIDERLEIKLEQKLKPIKKELRAMNRKLDTTIRYFDHVTGDHKTRIKRIETHLDLPPLVV